MWQDGLCFDSKSLNYLPEGYERGYRFRGKRLTIGEGLNSISSNQRNESMNHQVINGYKVFTTL